MKTDLQTREQWLNASKDILLDMVLTNEVTDNAPPPPVRVSVAPMVSKQMGVCHNRASSSDGHNEIFITAHIDDSVKILDVLTHELIHALDDCKSGHRNFFARVARKAGLEGKLTATHAGAELTTVLNHIVKILGPIPHAKLNLKPKSKGRNNNKIVCGSCGFQANLSRKWAKQVTSGSVCPACFASTLNVEMK
tara:strand:- start:3312 stop:3893 length:582 start_codon:yes stop_codon:yes gene_type:complete